MKTKIAYLIAALLLFTGLITAQDIRQSDVPTAVVNAFNKQFPKATKVEWERKGELYEVEFDLGGLADHEAWYNADGNMTRHKEEMGRNKLPKAVADAIKSQYKDYRIDDVEKITEHGKITYKVELENKAGDIDVYFSEDGTVVK